MSNSRQQKTKQAAIVLAAVATLGAAAYWLLRPTVAPLAPLPPVTIATPTQISSALVLVAAAQGLFQQAEVEVVKQPFLLGKDALKSVLDGKADLAVVADTPFMFAVHGDSEVAILAGISSSRRSLAIVARSDRGITRMADLAGKSMALTLGTNLPYFLDAMLQSRNMATTVVKRVALNTPEGINAIKQGQVDAAVVFQPFLAQLQTEMGDTLKTFYGEPLYASRFLLVGKVSYIDSHPQEIQRILRALVAADQSLATDPAAARRIVGGVVKVDEALMVRLFDPEDFHISLNQGHLLALEDQTRWAMAQGLVKPGPVPNYLTLMKYQHLEAVSPEAVQLVR